MNGFVIDIEANGLFFQADKIFTIVCKDLTDKNKRVLLNPFKDDQAKEKLLAFILTYDNPYICGHFILGYDIFVLLKILDIDFSVGPDSFMGIPCTWIDTLYCSMFLDPDRHQHSLEDHGKELGLGKIDWRAKAIELGLIESNSPDGEEFMQWHEELDIYCERDVDVNILLATKQLTNLFHFYGEIPKSFKCGLKSFFLMSCQELTGWRFNSEAGLKLCDKIRYEMKVIEDRVEPQLPPRKMKKGEMSDYKIPAKPFKKNGDISATFIKWLEKHEARFDGDLIFAYGKSWPLIANEVMDVPQKMTLGNQDDIKDWLLEQGWSPTLWNYKKDERGKPIRVDGKLVKTSPKLQEAQQLCRNLEKLQGPVIKDVVKWLSYRNRLSVLEGWLDNDRLKLDGRLGAGRTGITNTHRQKHRVLVNCPKADPKVLLGYEFRDLFICDDGMLIAAGDAAALEGRVQGHYTFKYDNGATAKELLEGDIHSVNAKAFYPDETRSFDIKAPDFNKEDPLFKPYRSKSKNGFYCILYGGAPPKLASTLGQPESMGQILYDAFWAANPATKTLKDDVEKYWGGVANKKYLIGIDGRRLSTRKKNALLNTIFQACGAIIMDYAGCFLDKWLGGIKFDKNKLPYYSYKGYIVRRIGYFHDEYEFECETPIANEIAKLIEHAIKTAGEYLKLSIPLAGEGKVGSSWKEVH